MDALICVYLIGLSCSSAKRAHRGYMLLIQHVAGFEEKLLALEVAELSLYFKEVSAFHMVRRYHSYSLYKLRKGASGARGDDAANLKPAVVTWIAALFENPLIPFSPSSKLDRGFESDITGQLLCPIDYNWNDESYVD
jgi:hypothetical protein